ncbi:MAG: LysR family transcriptional regulator [Pseudomonadota bacterium]
MPIRGDFISLLKGLDLSFLIVFEADYSLGNISQAAKSLGLNQSMISNALGSLRDTLDDPLFVHEGREDKPTPEAVTKFWDFPHGVANTGLVGIVPTAFAHETAKPIRW